MATISPYPNIPLTENSQANAAWMGWFERVRFLVNNNVINTSWANITGKPTTFAGFGISTTSADLAGSITDETGTGALVFATTPTLVTPVLGAATGTSVTLTGDITTGTGTLHKTSANLTNGAAAAAGTLLNAPAAGNPTKWVPIDDNGTIRYIPAW